jgi:hypothetical protein
VIRELWVGGLEISMGIFGAGGARAIFGLFSLELGFDSKGDEHNIIQSSEFRWF